VTVAPQPIGVCLRPEYDEYSLAKLGEYSRTAEARGFDSVWLAESWGHDSLALLSHIGALTSRVRLGTAIVNVFSRTPSLLAMSSVTLGDLYDGRFILGLGTSTRALVENWHGLRFERPVSRLRDAIGVIRQATSGQDVHWHGKTLSVEGMRLRIKPRNAPPTIYLAALAPSAMALVGELADGWLPYLLPARGLQESVARIRDDALRAGRPADAVCIAPMVLTAVSENADEARDAARRHIGFYLGAMGPHYRAFVARFGFEAEVQQIHAAWKRGEKGAAFAAVTDTMLDEIAVAGTPAECRDKLARLRRMGADLPILFFPGTCSNRMVELALETLAA
jgi:probable F420-dependent oxidoreductase